MGAAHVLGQLKTGEYTVKTLILAAAAALAATPALAVNNGFETGDLTGWTTNGGNAGATSSYHSFSPVDGDYLGFVEAGLGQDVASTLSQDFFLSAGGILEGYVGFQANDYLPFDDYASLTIGNTTVFSSSVSAVGDFGSTGWVHFSFTAPTAGTYTLQLAVANSGDNSVPSGAVLDVVSVNNGVVPEPASWAMLIAGFGLVGAVSRRRRDTVVAA
jgi:hypothetical protein